MDWKNLNLIFWQRGDKETENGSADAATYADFINAWYQRVIEWIKWPLQQFDLENAELFFVDLIAAERKVKRYQGEEESLYRLRVKHAYQNAKEAGSIAGFKSICNRLGLENLEINERVENEDWDIVELVLNIYDVSNNPELIRIIVENYGRTCRRYRIFTVVDCELKTQSVTTGSDNRIINLELDLDLGYLATLPDYTVFDVINVISDNDFLIVDSSVNTIPSDALIEGDKLLKENEKFLTET